MEAADLHKTLYRMAKEIVQQAEERSQLVLIGIHTGGVICQTASGNHCRGIPGESAGGHAGHYPLP